eukprot:CAMPEP_0170111818 /NCGR_PEP_ID=MMETSP0020_2-20130122/8718_1 /TAXON_ID=98059 /ORGANISM="Dinobryon sp., Strain UTEXLB2267" /LENGTH=54 /DNA_ID=CAMNT_0010337453 /DNA_START=158 /DNA_END=319 /DNA_ORIENTATION=-
MMKMLRLCMSKMLAILCFVEHDADKLEHSADLSLNKVLVESLETGTSWDPDRGA